MCLLILNKAEAAPLTEAYFKTAWKNNPHGGGLVYREGDRMVVRKTVRGWKKFYTIYAQARAANTETHFLVHFRWATHGKKNIENTHPFKVDDGVYFGHNGVLSRYAEHGKDAKSDTRNFIDRVLSFMPQKFYANADYIQVLSDHIGLGNKLVFLDYENDYGIVNESAGHWRDGSWFSNSGYLPRVEVNYGAGYGTHSPTDWSYGGKWAKKNDSPLYTKGALPEPITDSIRTGEVSIQNTHVVACAWEKSGMSNFYWVEALDKRFNLKARTISNEEHKAAASLGLTPAMSKKTNEVCFLDKSGIVYWIDDLRDIANLREEKGLGTWNEDY